MLFGFSAGSFVGLAILQLVVEEPLVSGPGTLGALAVSPALMAKFRECFFLARCCLGQVPGGAPFSQRSEQATACTNRMQIRN